MSHPDDGVGITIVADGFVTKAPQPEPAQVDNEEQDL